MTQRIQLLTFEIFLNGMAIFNHGNIKNVTSESHKASITYAFTTVSSINTRELSLAR